MQKTNDRQKEIVNFIIKFTKTNGYPPTMREIAKVVGISSSSTVHKVLHQCQEDGLIEIPKGVLRGIKATPQGKKLVRS